MRNNRQKFVFGARCGFGFFFGSQNFIFVFIPLSDRYENAVVNDFPFAFAPSRINKNGNVVACPGAERKVNFLGFAVEFEKRKEMCLVEDASGDREDFLHVKLAKLLAPVTEQLKERGIRLDDFSVVGKRQKTAWRIVK
jgi:hypothetical protein